MRLSPAVFAFTVLGCAFTTTARFTPSGAAQRPSHAASCEFQVLTAPPTSFVELGTVDVETNGGHTEDLGVFKQQIRARVCEAGGDAAIAIVNGYGQYLKATVIALSKSEGPPASN